MTIAELKNKIAHIPGFMGSDDQKMFFYELGRKGFTKAAEIGSYKGLSAAIVMLGLLENDVTASYYCIDTFQSSNPELKHEDTLGEFQKNTKFPGKKIEPSDGAIASFLLRCPIIVQGYSFDVVDTIPDDLDFIYIDGAHDVDSVAIDVKLYWPKVKDGGLMIMHDWPWESVRTGFSFAQRLLGENAPAKIERQVDDYIVFKK